MRGLVSAAVALVSLAASAFGASVQTTRDVVEERQSSTKYVFSHFILGIVASYVQSDWEADMQLAQSIGIDAFAIDIGTDSYTTQQLEYAYAAAEAVGFKVFISFDFSYYDDSSVSAIAAIVSQFQDEPAQFTYNGAPFVSTFIGDGFSWTSVEASTGNLFTCPNWQPPNLGDDNSDCGFNWNGWPSEDNLPIDSNMTTAGDEAYISALGSKPYMMPVSPWFFTHYGPLSYNKNWIFYSDYLFQPRWEQVLQIQPQFVEIVTWNDFSESHYIGPLHPDDTSVYAGGSTGAIEWVLPHDAWRDVAAVYIAAYKSGASAPTITTDELVYYYRPTPKNTVCSDSVPQPTGYEDDDDFVFVIALLTEAATVTISSGSNAEWSESVPAGVSLVAAPMGIGSQSFSIVRNGATVASGTSAQDISDTDCSVYNFNAYVGSIEGSGSGESGTVAVTFDLQKVTIFGEEVYITGSIDALSDWSTDPSQATLLSAADYTASDPLWFVTIDLPAETAFQYKFFIIETNGTVTWEADPNRSYTTGAGGSSASLSLSWQT